MAFGTKKRKVIKEGDQNELEIRSEKREIQERSFYAQGIELKERITNGNSPVYELTTKHGSIYGLSTEELNTVGELVGEMSNALFIGDK